jgi:hypothetical protein
MEILPSAKLPCHFRRDSAVIIYSAYLCEVSGFRRDVFDTFAFLGSYRGVGLFGHGK